MFSSGSDNINTKNTSLVSYKDFNFYNLRPNQSSTFYGHLIVYFSAKLVTLFKMPLEEINDFAHTAVLY